MKSMPDMVHNPTPEMISEFALSVSGSLRRFSRDIGHQDSRLVRRWASGKREVKEWAERLQECHLYDRWLAFVAAPMIEESFEKQ